jgi:hypothetical protein
VPLSGVSFPLSIPEVLESPAPADELHPGESGAAKEKKAKKPHAPALFPEDLLPLLVRLVHGSPRGREALMDEFVREATEQREGLKVSRAKIGQKIEAISERALRAPFKKQRRFVRAEVLAELGMADLPLPAAPESAEAKKGAKKGNKKGAKRTEVGRSSETADHAARQSSPTAPATLSPGACKTKAAGAKANKSKGLKKKAQSAGSSLLLKLVKQSPERAALSGEGTAKVPPPALPSVGTWYVVTFFFLEPLLLGRLGMEWI